MLTDDFSLIPGLSDRDHPGFRDADYRARREDIAALARLYRPGEDPPAIPYLPEEHEVWRRVSAQLRPLHAVRVHSRLRSAAGDLLDGERIPDLVKIRRTLERETGFRLEPVPGLVAPRVFLERLAEGVFPCTQYVRHVSRPFYTPEPDLIHELIGHVGSLRDPEIAALNRSLGGLARDADDALVEAVIRVYWFTLEFGLVREAGRVRAFGAGLLSSVGELEGFDRGPRLVAYDPRRAAETPYDPSRPQETFFVARSFAALIRETNEWIEARHRERDGDH